MSYRNNNINNDNGGGGNHSLPRGSSGGGRRGSQSRGPSNLSQLPVEQGIICSLKESFGFIHCAERPEEVFFHYSEVANCHPDELQIDTEVEFKVSKSGEKLAAYQVHALSAGTVVWEIEEEEGKVYQGLVEKSPRSDRDSFRSNGTASGGGGSRSYDTDGSVRVILDNPTMAEEEVHGDSQDKKDDSDGKSGPVVRLRAGEFTGAVSENSGANGSSNNTRLYRGDQIEFRILMDRRTKQKYARHIKLVQTEKERKRLENAVPEEGIITSLNNSFGFIKSNKRREDIYFHYSNVVVPEPDDPSASAVKNGNNEAELEVEFELKKGQEVKFLVVTESAQDQKSTKCSARQIECLPKGSVVFHTVEATGVKGIVTMCPHPPTPDSKGDDSREGRVRLLEPLKAESMTGGAESEDGATSVVDEVLLHFSDAPGGVFTYQNHRNQTLSALWIQEGDTLLFDVIKETIDGSYRAIPTMHTIGLGGTIEEPDKEEKEAKPVMRMVSPTLVGRAEGTVHALKNDYGFFHFAERTIDVHFRMYDLFPDEIQDDIRKQMGIKGPVKLEIGAGVQFDICAHGNITGGARNRHGRGNAHPHERENIRGQRIVILPMSAVKVEKVLVSGARGVIKSADSKQLYAGFLDIEESFESLSLDDRHPLVSKMLNSFMEESSKPNGRKTLVYRDTLGMKDDDVVVEMAKLKGGAEIECSHIPIPGIGPHPGRLCIRRKIKDGSKDSTEVTDEEENEGPTNKKRESNINKNIRFEKSSLDESLKDDIPPASGDIVTCDILQSRRSNKIFVRNMKMVERKEVDAGANPSPVEASGLGVVKDVLPKRSFGFISVLDDDASRREMLFFHLPKDRKGGGFRKGDEVKFDIATEGTKRIATNVRVVPKGTVPSAAAKNACLGYVLMEPSHTSLSDTPLRKAQSNMSAGSQNSVNSRWADRKDDPKKQIDLHEEGCILLLEDKSGMFEKKQRNNRRRRKKAVEPKSGDSSDDLSVDSVGSGDEGVSDGELSGDESATSDDENTGNRLVTLLSHLTYKNGSIAIHGSGVTSSMDGSGNPKRGDLVSFVKGRKRNTVRDVRVEARDKAVFQRGRLENIQLIDTESGKNKGKANFIAASEKEEVYEIDLAEVVSCNAAVLKEKESVEGILYEGKVFGICRTCDLYLSSKLGKSHKERPKLNLTVKKDRGGTIMAQSMMAKGPDGTNGFTPGWTKRVSKYTIVEEDGND